MYVTMYVCIWEWRYARGRGSLVEPIVVLVETVRYEIRGGRGGSIRWTINIYHSTLRPCRSLVFL
jgi:hypothetical protein